jgi:diketogulonate reductase-like aldo/keto reductase
VTSSPAPDTRKTANHRGHQKTGSRVRLDELYFLEYRKGLLDACREQRIALVAYSPLGTGRHLASETVTRVAHRLGRTAAQVLLRWCVQRGVPSIPKSRHRELIAENAQIFDFALSNEDVAQLDALDRTGHTERALERRWW